MNLQPKLKTQPGKMEKRRTRAVNWLPVNGALPTGESGCCEESVFVYACAACVKGAGNRSLMPRNHLQLQSSLPGKWRKCRRMEMKREERRADAAFISPSLLLCTQGNCVLSITLRFKLAVALIQLSSHLNNEQSYTVPLIQYCHLLTALPTSCCCPSSSVPGPPPPPPPHCLCSTLLRKDSYLFFPALISNK